MVLRRINSEKIRHKVGIADNNKEFPDSLINANTMKQLLKQNKIRHVYKIVLATMLISALFVSSPYMPSFADDELENELEKARENSEGIQWEIYSLNDELSDLSEQIENLATQITEKEEQIEAVQKEVEEAEQELAEIQEKTEAKYNDIKMWIKYSYEHDFDSTITSILSADTFSEFLNQAEHTRSLYDFGQNLLREYTASMDKVAEREEELKERSEILSDQLADLTALQEESSQQKTQVNLLIADAQTALAEANATVGELQAQLTRQKAEEVALEAARAKDNSENYSNIKEQESNNTSDPYVSTDEGDLDLLAAIIFCEAGNEIYECQVAVGCVVMNRVRSSDFPNTVYGVIYQSGQFSPVSSGRLATVLANNLATESCYEAAAYVLAGNLPYPDFLYFRAGFVELEGVDVTIIGTEQFF